mmetsp:Transcript_15174/g.22564  ORF Transcript_15174/g.22564 Transcript_15174/m.22564 type:complete len:163 (-) Transcript_15174:18-506(-)
MTTTETLRCLYTSQKSKKHKVWKDGAIRVQSSINSLSLFKWSESVGVTGNALGEFTLSKREMECFLSCQGSIRTNQIEALVELKNQTVRPCNIFFSEPEVEVENFLISIDGVSESVEQGENSLPNIFSRKRNLPNSGFKTPKRVINVPLKDEDIGSFQEGVY